MIDLDAVLSGENNRTARRELLEVLRSGNAVLFAGAGVAVPAGFPRWSTLLSDLEALCEDAGDGFVRDNNARAEDQINYAEAIKTHIQTVCGSLDPYYTHLERTFMQPPKLERFHRELVSLPFAGFITTNYDSTLEAALLVRERAPADKSVDVRNATGVARHRFYRSLRSNGGARQVAHIHGYHSAPSRIVLSAADYDDAYGRRRESAERPAIVDVLHTVVSFMRLVFVGFSFEDSVFAEFLDASSKRLSLWNSQTHFAIIGTSEDCIGEDLKRARRLRFNYGIETLFFARNGTSFQSLYDLITELCRELGVAEGSAIIDINDCTIEEMRG